MCCLYYFDQLNIDDIKTLFPQMSLDQTQIPTGDIHPSDPALIVTANRTRITPQIMRWGFKSYRSSQLLINARSETALEKPSFSESVLRRRCIIPAGHFYEWDRAKTKVTFRYPQSPSIYMAGFYNNFDGENRFIILTTRANASMQKVHDRMPLILERNEIEDWIFDDEMVREYLQKESPMLTREQEYEQLSLF